MTASRREVLQGLAALAALAACRGGGHVVAPPGVATELIPRRARPYCAEAPLEALCRNWVTPASLFYVLDHAAVPAIDAAAWRLDVGGEVARALRLGLDELRAMPSTTIAATLMCAGNRRREHHARKAIRGAVIWDAGAIGNARWTGVRLDHVLGLAGVRPGGQHVCFEGLDEGGARGGAAFGGSIPLARVEDRDAPPVLLAYAMNDEPLPAQHGFPVRAIVPGYIGARSVKWLGRVVVSDRPSTNPAFLDGHHLDGAPIYDYPINAAIGSVRRAGRTVDLAGYALAGSPRAVVDRVEVSADDGTTWRAAELDGPPTPGCWRIWRARLTAAAGAAIVARAIDSAGAVQPRDAVWNRDGYLYNGWPVSR